jgi:hypothetical protein
MTQAPLPPGASCSGPSTRLLALVGAILGLALSSHAASEPNLVAFTDRYCTSCHNDVDKEGGLDLSALKYEPGNAENFGTWVKVHDRVQAGEMPPKEKKRPEATDISSFIAGLGNSLSAHERDAATREGRVTQRRLNRTEYENALRDLFRAPWLQIQSQLPEDGEAFHFNKVSEALDVSHVHMSRYMQAADSALRQIVRNSFDRPARTTKRYYAREERAFTQLFKPSIDGSPSPDRRSFPVLGTSGDKAVRFLEKPLTVGDADPATREQEAVGWVIGSYEFPTKKYTQFQVAAAGNYRLRFSGHTIWAGPYGQRYETKGAGKDKQLIFRPRKWHQANPDDISPGRRNEPITVYAFSRGGNRRVGEFDLTPEPKVHEFDVFMVPSEVLDIDASRFYRSRPTGNYGEYHYTNPLHQRDGAPGVAFRWLEVDGPIDDEATHAGYRLMFGDLPVRKVDQPAAAPAPATGRRGGRGAPAAPPAELEVVSENPKLDAERLLRGFMDRAYRRPVTEKNFQRFLGLITGQLGKSSFTNAMIAGYTAVLASPEFVYLQEKPGSLDDRALATRLALFLWNSAPDEVLRQKAERGDLHRADVLRAETERMLRDPRSDRFVEAFLDYWLELRKMSDTTPSTTLYPDYYLDDMLTEAALTETRMYFRAVLDENLPTRTIVDSDFTFANEHLATHYGLKGVQGIAMRRVTLPAKSPRGGLMTQASVLKVTANGTTTSPVVRGKWIMERIVGKTMPPPPAAVPAVEPDIRGAVTIRQQLDKHRADEACAVCHRKIDPPGFALESFDVLGGWRDRYRATAVAEEAVVGWGKNGWPYQFFNAQPVETGGQLVDGRSFGDIRDFKRLLLDDEPQLARNLTRQFTVYATGAPIRFSDREAIERIVQQAKTKGFGVRDLLHGVIQSDLFLSK